MSGASDSHRAARSLSTTTTSPQPPSCPSRYASCPPVSAAALHCAYPVPNLCAACIPPIPMPHIHDLNDRYTGCLKTAGVHGLVIIVDWYFTPTYSQYKVHSSLAHWNWNWARCVGGRRAPPLRVGPNAIITASHHHPTAHPCSVRVVWRKRYDMRDGRPRPKINRKNVINHRKIRNSGGAGGAVRVPCFAP